MSVRIQRLSIRNFGPLRNLVLLPGPVTVVYGQNEAGKTSCIDALVRALRERVRPGQEHEVAQRTEVANREALDAYAHAIASRKECRPSSRAARRTSGAALEALSGEGRIFSMNSTTTGISARAEKSATSISI